MRGITDDPGVRTERDFREFLIDSALTLALFHQVEEVGGSIGDRLKAMKLLFAASYEAHRMRQKCFSFAFYRYTYGPFTQQVYETWEDLAWAGWLEMGPGPKGQIKLSEKGHAVAQEFVRNVLSRPTNVHCLRTMKLIAKNLGALSTARVLDQVYAMKCLAVGAQEPVVIRDMPTGRYLTVPLEAEAASRAIQIPTKWLTRFDQERLRAIGENAPESFRQGPELPPSEVEDLLLAAVADVERGDMVSYSPEDFRLKYGLD